MTKAERYARVEAALAAAAPVGREARMSALVDALWDEFGRDPYSWVGFYLLEPGGRSMVLGPRRDKPACSPLEMHGVCGRCAREGRTIVVDDVHALGADHIVCDPRNLSEICVPARDARGAVWAVLDADSESLAAFDDDDRRGLEKLLEPFVDESNERDSPFR
ncbi:MAG: GAF domain-containing protein [Elusimicrobiota bacterium]|nr:GAF domain-containing protein [Elusimicrobiota bacterium]